MGAQSKNGKPKNSYIVFRGLQSWACLHLQTKIKIGTVIL